MPCNQNSRLLNLNVFEWYLHQAGGRCWHRSICREDICIACVLFAWRSADASVFQEISTRHKIRNTTIKFPYRRWPMQCLLLCPDMTSSHQQVSLARSPLLKMENSNCEGLLMMSYDRTLVVKEICSEEVEEMHNILSEYHQVRPTLVWLHPTFRTANSANTEVIYARFIT